MGHYTDGRRWSEISKAWISETSWNDREEIASLRAQLATLTAERDALKVSLKEMTESKVRCWNEWTLAQQNVEQLEHELAQVRQVIAVCNKENLSDAVMNAIIENTQLKQQLHAAQAREERYKLALLDFLRTSVPEGFTKEQVKESRNRIKDHGGTLGYIAGLLHDKETP